MQTDLIYAEVDQVSRGCPGVDPVLFLQRLWRGGAHGFLWVVPGKLSYWIETAKMPARFKEISKNVYFGVHPVAEVPARSSRGCPAEPCYVRSQLDYVAAVNCLFADFDGRDFESKPEILAHIGSEMPEPSIIIDSGGGYHAYWLLRDTFEIKNDVSRDYIRNLQSRWATFTRADRGAKDLCRVLRLPGSVNYKPDYAPDYPRVTTVKADFEIEYTIAQLMSVLPPPPAPAPRPSRRVRTSGTGYERALQIAERMIDRASDGEKHAELLKAARLVGGYIAAGNESEAVSVLYRAIQGKSNVQNLNSALKTIEDGIEYGKAAPLN